MTHRVLASTTSHKREPLRPTLELFARLGLRDVDVNLYPFLEHGLPVEEIMSAIAETGQRVLAVSGGWCDFFHGPPEIEETFRSVNRQAQIAVQLGAPALRLFFGRLPRDAFERASLDRIVGNLQRLSDEHPTLAFVFENHDGASLVPEICRDVLGGTDRTNIRMNFDPINFERAGLNAEAALDCVLPFVAHLHLKGLAGGEYCAFGEGDRDLTPVLRTLLERGYHGDFTVEYEGHGDGTLQLYESVKRARLVLAAAGTARSRDGSPLRP